MKVIQVIDIVAFGDAIGNHVVAFNQALKAAGIQAELYTNNVDKRFPEGTAKPLRKLRRVGKDDILIYHMSCGTTLNRAWITWNCYKIMMYHNITPPVFFEPYSKSFAKILQSGLDDTAWLKDHVHECWVCSEFNRQDLLAMGYPEEKIRIMPGYLIPFEDYASASSALTEHKYADGITNVLFVGRLAPNKMQEDVIRSFACYKKQYDPTARLILIGSETMPDYAAALREYVALLELEDVIFPGHVSFKDIVSCYQTAKVFVCLSEHEGFCIPLVEAMYFDVPILAYDAGAIGGTLGGSGVLINDKRPAFIAKWIDRLVKDQGLRERVIAAQRKRLSEFDNGAIAEAYKKRISEL